MLGQQLLMVADRCDLSCTYCFFETGDKHYRPAGLDTADYDRWLSLCAKEESLRSVCLTGGEPLLRTDLVSLLEVARQHARHLLLLTNAVRMTDGLAAELKRLDCDVDVSIDHVSLDLPDQVRGATKATLAGIERLDAAGVRIRLIMVITSVNWRDTEQLLAMAAARNWQAELILISVPARHPLSLATLTEDERAQLAGVLTRWRSLLGKNMYYNRLRFYLRNTRLPPVRSCGTGENGIFVNPDGEIWVCAHRDRDLPSIGNIRSSTPVEVLARKQRSLRCAPAGPCASLACIACTE